jgi:hypothetical protein
MKNLLKMAVVAALSLAAVSASATDSRINSLSAGNVDMTNAANAANGAAGLSFNEKALTIRDTANIYAFPQYLPTYKNSVDADAVQGASYGTMNIRYALSDDAVLLLYGKRSAWKPVVNINSVAGASVPGVSGYSYPVDPTNHQFGIGFGMKAGETVKIGAHASIGGHNASTNQPKNNTLFDLTAGLGLELSETNSLDFGLNLGFGSFNDFNTSGQAEYQPAGIFNFGLNFKGEFQVHQIAKIVPYAVFRLDSRAVNHGQNIAGTNQAQQGSLSITALQLGSDLAIQPVEGVLIQPGIGLGFATSSVSGTTQQVASGAPVIINTADNSSNRIVPYYGFAAEAKAFDWMKLRLGARQQIVTTNIGNTAQSGQPSTEQHTSDVVNTVTTGMGFNLMGWDLDVNVNPSYFNNGVFAATGTATAWGVDWALLYRW